MAEIIMPRLSDTMQEGTITRWLKKSGDEVKKGDILAEVETDKANMEVESYETGVIEQILVQEGETVPIGQPIAIVGSGASAQKQSTATRTEAKAASPQASPVPEAQRAESPVGRRMESKEGENVAPAQTTSVQQVSGNGAVRVKASPLARRMAEEHGLDLSQIRGSGPGGRIVRDDIEDLIEQKQAAPAAVAPATPQPAAPAQQPAPVSTAAPVAEEGAEIVNLSSMQKTIVRRMVEAKQSIPHIYIGNEIDMTDALALRKTFNESAGEGGIKVSVNDLIIKACALALEKFPEANSSYRDGQFIRHKHINIGIAIDIPGGLIVPVIRDANIKGVRTIAREARALIEKAQTGKLAATDLDGGTFSISNLGMMDVTDFAAVVNPPQAAILAVGAARKTFVPINDQPVIRDIMHVTMSADHRILYGATTARFLQEIKRLLQNPYSLLG